MTRPARTDVLVAAAFLAAVAAEQAAVVGLGWEDVLKLGGCAALAWRRTLPVAANLTVVACFGAGEFAAAGDSDAFTTFAAIVLAMFSLAAHAPRRVLVYGLVSAAAMVVAVSVDAGLRDPQGQTAAVAAATGVLFGLVVVCVPTFGIGLLARRQAQLRARLAEQAAAIERERDRHAAAAATAERARVADELHAVVETGVRAMLAEVDAARRTVAGDPARAGAVILRVEERGREALAEMRRLLGVLRHGDEDLALMPQPSLTRLDLLARELTRTGLEVSLRIEGEPRAVSPGLDVAAYRVIEEALACSEGAHRADVVVRWTAADRVEVEVGVDGPQLADVARLDGARERVALFDGRLEAGRRPRGGSAMRAGLPVGAAR